jgi:hypothetical protein
MALTQIHSSNHRAAQEKFLTQKVKAVHCKRIFDGVMYRMFREKLSVIEEIIEVEGRWEIMSLHKFGHGQ